MGIDLVGELVEASSAFATLFHYDPVTIISEWSQWSHWKPLGTNGHTRYCYKAGSSKPTGNTA